MGIMLRFTGFAHPSASPPPVARLQPFARNTTVATSVMLTIPGHHLGDSWYFVDDNVAHGYFLICPDSVPRHSAWDIAHATSKDLRNWRYHGIVLRRGSPESFDGFCLATGTVLLWGGRYWMAYTGNWCGPRPAVGLAVSDDLHRWEKVGAGPITTIDEHYYTAESRGRRPFPHWRDPFLLAVDGFVYQLVCATGKQGRGPAGTIGVARTRDMHHWETLPPLEIQPFAEELECPQVLRVGDRSLLLFSTPTGLRLDDDPAGGEEPGQLYWMVGDGPLGPFRSIDPAPLLPSMDGPRPYAARAVSFEGRTWLLGTVWCDEGDYLSDPIELPLVG